MNGTPFWLARLRLQLIGAAPAAIAAGILCIHGASSWAVEVPRTSGECRALVKYMELAISRSQEVYGRHYDQCRVANDGGRCFKSWDFDGARDEIGSRRRERDALSGECYRLAESESFQRLTEQRQREKSQSVETPRERQLQLSTEQYRNQRAIEERNTLGAYTSARKQVDDAQRAIANVQSAGRAIVDPKAEAGRRAKELLGQILKHGAANVIAETEDGEEDENYNALHDTAKDAINSIPKPPGVEIIHDVMNDALKNRNNQTLRDAKAAAAAIQNFEPGAAGEANSRLDPRWSQTSTPSYVGAAATSRPIQQIFFREPATGQIRTATEVDRAAPGDNPEGGEAGCTRNGLGRVTLECERIRSNRMATDILSRIQPR